LIEPDLFEGGYTLGDASSDLLVGITSFGYASSEAFRPGVYTRIAYFRDWLDCIVDERVCDTLSQYLVDYLYNPPVLP